MVKPPLRTKSIGFKVSEEEYAQLETAAQTSGRTLGEWCREIVLGHVAQMSVRESAPSNKRYPPALRPAVLISPSLW
jgi:hypothetical protein